MTRLAVAAVLLAGAAGAAPPQDAPAIAAFIDRLQTTTDVAWLEEIAASESFLAAEWRRAVHHLGWNKDHRTDAYLRLGALGTGDSLAAMRRVEARLRGARLLDDGIDPGEVWTSPAPGLGSQALAPQTSAIVGERSYGVLLLEVYGPFAPYLVWQDPADRPRWSRPRLAGPAAPGAWSFEPALARSARSFRIAYHPRAGLPSTAAPPPSHPVDLDAVARDTDGDGWTDLEEAHLGLNSTLRDSDGDGMTDDVDVTPLHAPTPDEATDASAAIVRRALFATHGLSGSRWAVFVPPGPRPVQLYGHLGPVLFGVTLPTRDDRRAPPPRRGGAQTTWTIPSRTADRADVEITDWAGISLRTTTRVTLRRIDGEWIAVERRRAGMR
jgi:hypothetical protein